MSNGQYGTFAATVCGTLRAWRVVVAAAIALVGLATAQAAPVVDTLFGTNGIARVGGVSGAEDFGDAAFRMADGRIVVAGRTQGRTSHNFALRFLATGQLDPTFGVGGVTLVDPEVVLGNVRQVAVRSDGAVSIGGFDSDSAFILRLTAAGAPDPTFGSNGVVRQPATTLDTVWFVPQPDARLLVVRAGYQQPTLHVTRVDANGAADAAFGERVVSAPTDYYLSTLPPIEDGEGGFVVQMNQLVRLGDGSILFSATSPFALMRVTAEGALAAGFGNGGLVRGTDLAIPYGWVRAVARGANGTWLVAATSSNDVQSTGTPFALRLLDTGAPDPSFGANGRSELPDAVQSMSRIGIAPLAGGGGLIGGSGGGEARIAKIGATGILDPNYGQAGVTALGIPGYPHLAFVAGFADAGGASAWVGTLSKVLTCTIACFESGRDAGVVVLEPNGQIAAGYGLGGVAAWDRAESSTDSIDSLYALPSGAVVLAGASSASGSYQLFVARYREEGVGDPQFGAAGRAFVAPTARCYGPLQAAGQPSGAIAVSAGAAYGSACTVGGAQNFRLDAGGTPLPYAPQFAVPDIGNATDALVARPDGRLVHATAKNWFSLLPHVVTIDQALPDGTPDPAFGTNGRVQLAIPGDGTSRNASLMLLPDGSLIAATVTSHGLALYKLDAAGQPVAGFGTGGTVFIAGEYSVSGGFGRAVGIAVMEDTSLYVQYDASTAGGGSVQALRLSPAGTILSQLELPAGTSRTTFAVLADDSVVIAGAIDNGNTTVPGLRRLLRNDTFDPAFGPGGAFALPGTTSIFALAPTIEGNLIVGADDATSSLLLRLLMTSVVAPSTVVEFHNTVLDHYFVTANPLEAAAVDAGAAGPGWSRTGLTFRSGGANEVCRFYGNALVNPATGAPFGPNSHFYTATPAECAFLLSIYKTTEKSWHFESYDFATTPPLLPAGTPEDQATCPAGTLAVYRAYNRGFERGEDSNHRLTSSLSQYQATVARGWAGEGVRMCAPPDVTTQ